MKALRKIVTAEGIEAETEALAAIAANSNGDMRAAVRDLESIAMGRTVITEADTEHLSNRVVQKSIYDLMYNIFRKNAPASARKMMMDVDEDTDMVMLWVDENMPYEYKDRGDLVRGYERLSRADIFMGRIRRRQYYGFLRYASDMMSMGVASAKRSSFVNRERFRTPSYLTKMSRSKGMRSTKKEACLKLAEFTHNSTKRVSQDVVPALRQMLLNDPEMRVMLIRKAGLEEDELAYVMGVKTDSKAVAAAEHYGIPWEAIDIRQYYADRDKPLRDREVILLRYYEQQGLLASSRREGYAYRVYDEENIARLRLILVLGQVDVCIFVFFGIRIFHVIIYPAFLFFS